MRGLLPQVLVCLALGCTTGERKPLDPGRTEADFRHRSLVDPGLRVYLESHVPEKLPSFPPPSWDLSALALVAFYYHCDIELAWVRLEGAEARLITAGAWRNPTVGADLGRTFGDRFLPSPAIFGFDLDMPIELSRKRHHRRVRAQRLSEAARLEVGEATWKVYSRLRAALLEHLLAARELEARRAEEAARAEWLQLMEARLAVGAVSVPDVEVARIEHARARLDLVASQGQTAETRAALASSLGLPPSALEGASLAWEGLERPPAEDALPLESAQAWGLLNRLDVRRLLLEYEAALADLRLEFAKRIPDVNLNPSYLSEQGEKKFVVGISFQVPLLNQNQGPIAESEARRKKAAAMFMGLQAEAIGSIEAALERYRAALAELSEAERLLALSQGAERAARSAVEVGQEDALALAARRVETSVATRGRFSSLWKAQAALGTLEDELQRPLDPRLALPEVPPRSAWWGRLDEEAQ